MLMTYAVVQMKKRMEKIQLTNQAKPKMNIAKGLNSKLI